MPIDYDSHVPKRGDFPDRPNVSFDVLGKAITGTVLEARTVKTRRGDDVLLYVLADDAGQEWNLWGSAIDLEAQLMAHQVQEGDKITVTYADVRQLDSGTTMKLFDIICQKAENGNTAPADKPQEGDL